MRTRLPVKLKVAVLSSALTFAILCLFAVVVGAVAEQRIVAGFDDDLRASVGELQDRITLVRLGDDVQLSDSATRPATRSSASSTATSTRSGPITPPASRRSARPSAA
jgi:hypothetical protein